MREFEDEAARPARPKHTLSSQLADVIESRGLTANAAAKLADVDPGAVSRFMTGKTGITSETFDKLGRALGLRLVESGVRRREPLAIKAQATSRPAPAAEALVVTVMDDPPADASGDGGWVDGN